MLPKQLLQLLTRHFNDGELRTLCFELNVDYDSLSGQNRDDKARELILHCRRYRHEDDLIEKCGELRPKVSWADAHAGTVLDRPDPIFFVPTSLPAEYVRREEALAVLRRTLLENRTTGGLVALTALHGLGGLGKTVLARAICDDDEVRRAFPDGVVWATFGQRAEPSRHQRDWIGALGGDLAAVRSLEAGKVELWRLLEHSEMLLVLDDVWDAADAQWLHAGGPRCATLLTTRDATQAPGAALVPLELMRRQESRVLLQRAAKGKLAGDALADTIAGRLGHLPLALNVVGALLAKKMSWSDITEALDEGDLQFLDHGQSSVLAVIATSVGALAPERAARYRELVVFPADESLDEAAVVMLWAGTGGLKPRMARRLLVDLRDRALIQADNTLHDLQHDYLRAASPAEDQRHWHGALADSYGAPSLLASLPDEDARYGWRRLAYHLKEAGRTDELRTLLTNGVYLQGKLARLGTPALLEDFALPPNDELLRRMAGALRLGAHILDREPRELESQLRGRLGSLPDLHDLPDDGLPCFRLESMTLTPPEGSLLRTLAEHETGVQSCTFSPNGKLALSASDDGTLRMWEVTSGLLLRTLEGHTGRVTSCVFSPDGKLVLSASDDGTLRMWEVKSGLLLRTLEGHTGRVTSCVFSPDGKLALSASTDRTLRIWEVPNGQPLRVLEGHRDWVTSCSLGPGGQLALSVSYDGTLRMWEVTSGQLLRTLEGHMGRMTSCVFSPDGRLALSGSDDGTLRVWKVTSGLLLRTLEGHHAGVNSCIFSRDGRLALSASDDRTLRIWEVANWQPLHILAGHTGGVRGCDFSPDGKLALSASDDGTLRLWEVASSQPPLTLEGHTGGVRGCDFSPDGKLALSASDDGTLRLWDATTKQPIRVLAGHTNVVTSCTFSPDGQLVLSASIDCTLRVWNMISGQLLQTLTGHEGTVNSSRFSPDGLSALSGAADYTLRIWKVKSGQLLRTFEGHTGVIWSCAFSPDGRLALSASSDSMLRLWEVASGQLLRTFEGHTDWVTNCAFSPDGSIALSASTDHTLRMWGVVSGQLLRTLEGHTNFVTSCVFSPDGRLALSVSFDNTMRVWEVANGMQIACWHADAPLYCCAFHPDGRRIIAGDGFGNLHWLRVEGV